MQVIYAGTLAHIWCMHPTRPHALISRPNHADARAASLAPSIRNTIALRRSCVFLCACVRDDLGHERRARRTKIGCDENGDDKLQSKNR